MTVKYLITKTFTITLIFSSVNVAISFYFFSLEYFLVLSLSFYGSLCVPIFILMLNFKILLWIQWAWPWLKFLWQRVQDISLSISFALMFNICSKWNKCFECYKEFFLRHKSYTFSSAAIRFERTLWLFECQIQTKLCTTFVVHGKF